MKSKRLEESTIKYLLLGGGVLLTVGAIAGGAYAYVTRRKSTEGTEESARPPSKDGTAAAPEAEHPEVEVDFEKLLKLVAKRAAQQVGPKLAKASSARSVLESRVWGLKNKAARFLFDEVLGTVGQILREVEAEEVMLLFDPAAAAAAHLPPSAVLLAGLMSPVVLTISLIVHISQVVLVLLPVLAMCAWAVYIDWDTLDTCAVPTIWYWVYVQGGLALVLALAHLASMFHIQTGKRTIQEKANTMKQRLKEAVSDGELSLDEMREIFTVSAILLQHAVIVEDGLRRSIWRTIIGYGTLLWMLMTLWTFVIVLGWTFLPGQVAFHAKAASVAGGDFCGAWATVFTARLACVVSLLFLMFNMVSVVQFVSDRLVSSETYSAMLLSAARSFDETTMGIPFVQTLVKAFLLRGTADQLHFHIAASKNKTKDLERQKDALQSQIAILRQRIDGHKAEAERLKQEAGIVDDSEAVAAKLSHKGASTAEEVTAQARALEQSTREEMEKLYGKIMEAASQLRNSDMVQGALAQAQQAAEAGTSAAQQARETGLQGAVGAASSGLQQASAAASAGVAHAQTKVDENASSCRQG